MIWSIRDIGRWDTVSPNLEKLVLLQVDASTSQRAGEGVLYDQDSCHALDDLCIYIDNVDLEVADHVPTCDP